MWGNERVWMGSRWVWMGVGVAWVCVWRSKLVRWDACEITANVRMKFRLCVYQNTFQHLERKGSGLGRFTLSNFSLVVLLHKSVILVTFTRMWISMSYKAGHTVHSKTNLLQHKQRNINTLVLTFQLSRGMKIIYLRTHSAVIPINMII